MWRAEDKSWKMPATVAEFNEEVERQEAICETHAETRRQADHQRTKYEEERKEKLLINIKRAREQQVAALLARKKQAK